jgi:hypothetical protein
MKPVRALVVAVFLFAIVFGGIFAALSIAEIQMLDGYPSDRHSVPIVYDSGSDRIIMFGGWRSIFGDPAYSDTWEYDFNVNTWVHTSPAIAPSNHSCHAIAYDAESDRTILFSGHRRGGSTTLESWQETWAYDCDSNTWTNRSPSNMPSPRIASTMAYDSESDVIVLFGGLCDGGQFNNETWVYDYNEDTWTNMDPPVGPSRRAAVAMAYDSQHDRVIMYGGGGYDVWPMNTYTGTWAYDYNSNTWTEMNSADHPSSIGMMVYDEESEVCVFFGGALDWFEEELVMETWTYDYGTNTWTERSPDLSPSARGRGYMAYDSESDRTVLYGGGWLIDMNSYHIITDWWSYDVNTDTWEQLGPPIPLDPLTFGIIGGGVAVIAFVIIYYVREKRIQ